MMEMVALALLVGFVYYTFEYCSICSTHPHPIIYIIMHGIVDNNNNNMYPPQNLAGLRNNMLPPPPRNMHAGNPPVGTVYIPRENDNMSQLSGIRNFQLHTRNNQNYYFGEGNEDDQYPPGLSESVMYSDDYTLSESTRPDGRYGGDEYLYEN